MTDEQKKSFAEEMAKQVKTLVDESNAKNIKREDFDKEISEIKVKIDTFKEDETFKGVLTSIHNIEATQKAFDEFKEKIDIEIQALKDSAGHQEGDKIKTLKQALAEVLESEAFTDFQEKGFSGHSKDIQVKGVVDITNDYTGGTTNISTQSPRVLIQAERKINMRDLMVVVGTDQPYLVFQEVYDEEYSPDMKAENGTLTESSFKVRENEVSIKRIGTYINVSKRMLNTKGLKWLAGHLAARFPEKIRFTEDFQILFGDNAGNNLNGLVRNAVAFSLTGNSGVAGSISSVATYNSGTQVIITFAAAHELRNGDNITIAASTNYNATYRVRVIKWNQIMVDATYVAEATAAWTFTSTKALYQKISEPQQLDVLRAGIALLNQAEYQATGIVLNPMDVARIEMLKSTTNDYLDNLQNIQVTRTQGVLRVGGIPVVETTAMPDGEFLMGDFRMAVELLEFTTLTMKFADDVSYILSNQVAAIAEEEILMPIYNKYMLLHGVFEDAIQDLDSNPSTTTAAATTTSAATTTAATTTAATTTA